MESGRGETRRVPHLVLLCETLVLCGCLKREMDNPRVQLSPIADFFVLKDVRRVRRGTANWARRL